ncbi:STAS domain-containing protein [Mycolicibacterium vanbaalenii]|uniref:STAS domain-containing protein n=1 Tax=Mycolicibacterium vanbaalenii TaxID=110539 RepID=UPI00132F9E2C|nr:STAS domain-containing protein [Mycolicibacterium vanbaalenii]
MTAHGDNLIFRPDPASAVGTQRCGGATFAVRQPSSTRICVAVMGDVDAVNGRALGRYVERHTRGSRQLVLDLRAVDFFGTAGFTALHFTSVHCTRSDVDWVIVGNRSVRRLLSACDPNGELPLVDELSSALLRLDRLAQCCHPVVWTGRSGWHTDNGPRAPVDHPSVAS